MLEQVSDDYARVGGAPLHPSPFALHAFTHLPHPPSLPFVNEGQSRWIAVCLSAAAFWIAFFHRVAPGAIAGDLQTEFAVSGAALGALAAAYFYVYALMQLPTGVLADTLGPRKVLTAGGIVAGIGSVMFGVADSAAAAGVGRALAGLGVSVAFISALKLNANWFSERHFATSSSLTNVIGLSGALAATVPLAWLVTQISWRIVFIAIGMASFVIAIATWRLMRDSPAGERSSPAQSSVRWHHGLGEVMRNRATWAGFWVSFGLSGSYMSFVGLWSVPMLIHTHGATPVEATRHVALIVITLAISSVGISIVSDHLRRRRAVMIAAALLYCGCWVLWLHGVPREWTYAMFALTGLCAPGFVLSWAYSKEVNRPRYAGMATSLANSGGFLAAGIMQPLVGYVLDRAAQGAAYTQVTFRAGLWVIAAFALAGFIGTLFLRETHCRNIWAEKLAREKT